MTRKSGKPGGGHRPPNGNQHHATDHKREVPGAIHVRGEIEANLPADLVKQYETANRDNEAREGRNEKRDRWRFWVEVITFVVLAIYAGFTCKLMLIGNEQSKAMSGQLIAMNQQLDVMRKSERAWISVKRDGTLKVAAGSPLICQLTAKNIGKTVATNIFISAYIEFIPNDGTAPRFNGNFPHMTYDNGLLVPEDTDDLQPIRTKKTDSGDHEIEVITKEEALSFENEKSWVAVHGIVLYDDVFNIHHRLRFCIPTTVGKPGNFTYRACTNYNSVEKQ